MKWANTLLAVMVASTVIGAGEPTPTAVVVPRSEQVDVRSKAGRTYRLFIQGPSSDQPVPTGGYPVYYFTDANTSFALVTALARIQRVTIGPVVLVGIGYPTDEQHQIVVRRAYDLTPAAAPDAMKRFWEARKTIAPRPQRATPLATPEEMKFGGQAEFFAFIQNEVKPLIAKRFAIDKTRQALFGHSFGGLFSLYALYAHPEAFQVYISASPSLWLHPQKLAEDAGVFAKAIPSMQARPRLLVTLGGLEPAFSLGKPDSTFPQADLVKRLKAAGLYAEFLQFAGENHGSVVPFAHMRGLRFAFETLGK